MSNATDTLTPAAKVAILNRIDDPAPCGEIVQRTRYGWVTCGDYDGIEWNPGSERCYRHDPRCW